MDKLLKKYNELKAKTNLTSQEAGYLKALTDMLPATLIGTHSIEKINLDEFLRTETIPFEYHFISNMPRITFTDIININPKKFVFRMTENKVMIQQATLTFIVKDDQGVSIANVLYPNAKKISDEQWISQDPNPVSRTGIDSYGNPLKVSKAFSSFGEYLSSGLFYFGGSSLSDDGTPEGGEVWRDIFKNNKYGEIFEEKLISYLHSKGIDIELEYEEEYEDYGY